MRLCGESRHDRAPPPSRDLQPTSGSSTVTPSPAALATSCQPTQAAHRRRPTSDRSTAHATAYAARVPGLRSLTGPAHRPSGPGSFGYLSQPPRSGEAKTCAATRASLRKACSTTAPGRPAGRGPPPPERARLGAGYGVLLPFAPAVRVVMPAARGPAAPGRNSAVRPPLPGLPRVADPARASVYDRDGALISSACAVS